MHIYTHTYIHPSIHTYIYCNTQERWRASDVLEEGEDERGWGAEDMAGVALSPHMSSQTAMSSHDKATPAMSSHVFTDMAGVALSPRIHDMGSADTVRCMLREQVCVCVCVCVCV